jgi:hypothetical protein
VAVNFYLRSLCVLCALWAGCADFKKEEEAFCQRNPASCGEQPVPPGPASLAFSTPPQTVQVGSCSAVVTVQLRDAQGGAVSAAADTAVELSAAPANGFQFFTQAVCTGTAVTAVTIPTGSSSASFYFKGARAGMATLTAATGTLSGNQAVTLTPSPAVTLAVTLPSGSVSAGTCLSGGLVEVKDATGANTRVSAVTSVSLEAAPSASLRFYSDATCTTPVTGVTLRPDVDSAAFYVEGQAVGTVTVTVSANGLAAATRNLDLQPGAGNQLSFRTPPRAVSAGTCSAVVQVQSQDAQGNASPVSAATAIALSTNPGTGFRFYSDPTCGTEVTSVTLAAGSSDANFYFRGTKAGSVTVTATAIGFTGNSQTGTINPGSPMLIALPGPQTLQANSCSSAVTATLQDAYGNPTNAAANVQLNLSAGSVPVSFFSDNMCATSVASVTVLAGTGSKDFFVRSTQAGTYNVTVAGTGLTQGTVSVTVTPGAATVLAFTTAQQVVPAGGCSAAVAVQLRDSFSNPVNVTTATPMSLSAAPPQGVEFFTQAGCAGAAVTTVNIAPGSSSASFYFRGTRAGSVTLGVAANSLTGSQPASISPGPPAVLEFLQLPSMATAGNCTQATLRVSDNFGNVSPVSANQTVSLTANPGNGFSFYLSNSCNGASVTQITIPSGTSTANLSFKGTTAGQVSLTATAGTLSPATGNTAITALAASKLVFTTVPHSVTAGTCSPIVSVEAADVYGNPAPVSTNQNVALSQSGTPGDTQFRFYSDAACSTSITSVPIPAGQTTASFFYLGAKARTVAVTADGLSLADASQNHAIIGANAVILAFSSTTPPAQLLAGTCALRTVESFDIFGNRASNALTLTLSAAPVAEFFSDSGCTVPMTQVAIPAGSGSASFYFKGAIGGINAAAELDLTASASGQLSVTQTESILPTVRTGTCTMSASASITTCSITPALSSLSRSFLVFQATHAGLSSGAANVRCYLNSTTQVRCDRGSGSGGVVTIQWSVADFPSGVNVQHSLLGCTGETTTVSLNPVVRGSSFLLLSGRYNGVDQGTTAPRLAELTTTTTAEIRKTVGCGPLSAADANALQVVEYLGASVQRGVTSLQSGATNKLAGLNPVVAMDRSILLFSWLSDGSGNKICDRVLRGDLSNGLAARFWRGEGDTNCAGSNFTAISYEVVEFPPGTFVQQLTQQLAAGTTSSSISLPTPVDASRTLVLLGGQGSSGQVHGEGRHATSELMAEMRARASLNAQGTTVTLTRDTANASATFTFYVVQLKP